MDYGGGRPTNLIIFMKPSSAPIYTVFRREARAEKRKNYQKILVISNLGKLVLSI